MAISGYTNEEEKILVNKLFQSNDVNINSNHVNQTGGLFAAILANEREHYLQAWNIITRVEKGIRINAMEIAETSNSTEPNDQFYDDLINALIDSFSPVKQHPFTLEAGLTGGKDSRIIISVLKYINADFKTYTSGYDEHPDVIVAKQIAKQLDLEHNVIKPTSKNSQSSSVTQDILERTRQTLFSTDGMITGYENVPKSQQFNSRKIILGGNGGEHLRGGYNRLVSRHDRDGARQLFYKKLAPFRSLILPEAADLYQKHLDKWMNLTNSEDPTDIMAKYFVFYRTGRWSSVARSGYTHNNYVYQPFFESKLNKMLNQIPAKYLINDEVIYNIVKRLQPELVDTPFFAVRWKFEANVPRKGFEKEWVKRTPITAESQSKGSFNWRRTTLTDMKEAMAEEIFSKSNETVFDIVSKQKVDALFHSDKYANNREIDMFVWNLYSTAVLLSNKWLNQNGAGRIVEIDLPPTKVAKTEQINFREANMETNSNELRIKPKDNKLIIQYGRTSDSQCNLYVQTIGGKFTSPPDKKFNHITSLGNFKEYKIEFQGQSTKNVQKIDLFFMCYTKTDRIFNKSVTFNLTKNKRDFSFQFKPPKSATNYKIAIKIIRNENTKEKVILKKMVIKSLI